jgi:uncharacterized protein YbjT (DUF2867 family)
LARALIVGCGCRGQVLGRRLAAEGWSLRGTTRDPEHVADIEAAGIEPAVADPDRPGTLLDLVGDVTVVHWLLGTAQAEPEVVVAIHGPRLEALLERLIDTPVRGFVYEAAGDVERQNLEHGAGLVRSAAETWHIPVEVVEADPADFDLWLEAMTAATQRLVT